MERILVGIDAAHPNREAMSRAISLAERIAARVFLLIVLSPEEYEERAVRDLELERSVRKRIERVQLEKPRMRRIELFTTRGNYEKEVIDFTSQYKISLFVAETGDSVADGRESQSIEKIRHRLNCRVELITPKYSTEKTRGQK